VPIGLVFAAYAAAFGAAALACFASLLGLSRIESADTRRGFAALLAASGVWAAAELGVLTAPSQSVGSAFHIVGLLAGFTAVGAWLYFCSAYSGRTLHRDPRYRRAAVVVFLAVASVKVTNPLHSIYFTTGWATEPFPHVAVRSGTIHWVVAGLAYALSAVGYFMLLELFEQTSLDTRPLTALAALTALPVGFTVAGQTIPELVKVAYEPLGVAAFAVGALFVFAGSFESIRVTGNIDEPVVFVDEDGRVRDYNEAASGLFPALDGADGDPLGDALPDVAAALDDSETVIERGDAEDVRYFLVTANPFTVGRSEVGRMLLFSEVTDSERHRRELERRNERLSQFASVLSHDLRNPLNVAQGRVALVRERTDSDDLASVGRALDRMEVLIADILALARQGETIGDTERVALRAVAEEAWENVDTGGASLTVARSRRLDADRTRLVQLFENLFRNAVEHAGDASEVVVYATDAGFAVEDDGPGIPEDRRESVFEPGETTAEDGTGFGLAIVRSIADAHGWTVTVGDSETGGARFEVRGVDADAADRQPATND
jgi:signal transduction histidine kinase